MKTGRPSRIPARLGRRRQRSGAILLQAAFLLLVLMGLVAVVVDMGIARATQGFMQASSDAAALEGLRFRDVVPGDAAASDLMRRQAAARAAALVYDEDLDLSTGPAQFILGAGPQVETGVAGIDDPAGGTLVLSRPYVPRLQTNAGRNAANGDLVAGTFASVDPADPSNAFWHSEDGTYTRTDFRPANSGGAPDAPAFLVRLRRSNDALGLDAQPGVSSSGPALPFLFGLGSGVLTSEDPETYDPRRDGLTIRATSIADARPALAAGVMGRLVTGLAFVGTDTADPALRRVVAFEDASWLAEIAVDGPFEITVSSDGAIAGGGLTPSVVGLAQPVATWMQVGSRALAATTPSSVLLPTDPSFLVGLRYVALYVTSGGEAVITGFAAIDVTTAVVAPGGGGEPVLTLTGTKLSSLVAPENASAVPALAADPTALLTPSPARGALLAPVLAR